MPQFRILMIGDIVGQAGVDAVEQALPDLRQEKKIDFCIANAENSHEGKGVNEAIVRKLYKAGVDVLTGGDHSFDKHLIFPYMARDNRLLRPMNYPRGVPGYGYGVYAVESKGIKVAVINLRGQAFFQNPIRCPFQTADYVLEQIGEQAAAIFLDFHAEATAEKIAMAWYLDGRITAMVGTHTHVQTGDERIFPQGMGYLTDVGFTGPHNSVIGMDKNAALQRFLLQTPQKYQLGEGDVRINAAIYNIDLRYGKTLSIERLNLPVELAQAAPAETVVKSE